MKEPPHPYTPEQVAEICQRLDSLKERTIPARITNPIAVLGYLNHEILAAFQSLQTRTGGSAAILTFILHISYCLFCLALGMWLFVALPIGLLLELIFWLQR